MCKLLRQKVWVRLNLWLAFQMGHVATGAASGGGVAASAAITSYLKSYPYLFVRESDQTDYFCTGIRKV